MGGVVMRLIGGRGLLSGGCDGAGNENEDGGSRTGSGEQRREDPVKGGFVLRILVLPR